MKGLKIWHFRHGGCKILLEICIYKNYAKYDNPPPSSSEGVSGFQTSWKPLRPTDSLGEFIESVFYRNDQAILPKLRSVVEPWVLKWLVPIIHLEVLCSWPGCSNFYTWDSPIALSLNHWKGGVVWAKTNLRNFLKGLPCGILLHITEVIHFHQVVLKE